MKLKENVINSIISVFILSIIIIAATIYFIYEQFWIGPIFISLGFLHLLILKLFKRNLKSIWPDLIFGIIDNGILIIAAIIGADFAGILGAIVGGASANAITDGFAGIFEGWTAQYLIKHKIKDKRTALSASIGKMTGCFFGAGIIMTILWTII
ncbi:MAG: hypothetical protein PHF86_07000 [Candidatus Nanoarchaeia archaeon]|nr:hypothetical protein [Candidatus Nanoarchaeia archaeon]